MRTQTKVEPIAVGRAMPPGGDLMANKRKGKGRKAQKRLGGSGRKGELEAIIVEQPENTVEASPAKVAAITEAPKPVSKAEQERLAKEQRKALRAQVRSFRGKSPFPLPK